MPARGGTDERRARPAAAPDRRPRFGPRAGARERRDTSRGVEAEPKPARGRGLDPGAARPRLRGGAAGGHRPEEHTFGLQALSSLSYTASRLQRLTHMHTHT